MLHTAHSSSLLPLEMVMLDVVEDILLRLDVKDILLCKSVCRSWYSLISSNLFVKSHLIHTYNKNRDQLGHRRIVMPRLVDMTDPRLYVCLIIGSSNGLVCICPYAAEFLVTNPSTRELKRLQTIIGIPHKDRWKLCWGFGYDSSTDDYKLVVGIIKDEQHLKFQVLTLKSNIWRTIGEVKYTFNNRSDGSGILCNGALHWFMDDNNKKRVLLSFDLCSEEFKEIPQPDDTRYVCDCHNRLGIFEECLCIFRIHHIPWDKWVKRNYNEEQSWQLLPDNPEMKYDVAHSLNYIPDNSSSLFDDQDICVTRTGLDISAPMFLKSLVSPHLNGKLNKTRSLSPQLNGKLKKKRHLKNSKRIIKVVSVYDLISRSFRFSRSTLSKKRKRQGKSNKRNGKEAFQLFDQEVKFDAQEGNQEERAQMYDIFQ
ncbi:putative F-box domain-containing protein [Tanacetum coccineum]